MNGTALIRWMVFGWLPAVVVWTIADGFFATMCGVGWLGLMYWYLVARNKQGPTA